MAFRKPNAAQQAMEKTAKKVMKELRAEYRRQMALRATTPGFTIFQRDPLSQKRPLPRIRKRSLQKLLRRIRLYL